VACRVGRKDPRDAEEVAVTIRPSFLPQRKPGAGIRDFKYLNKIKNWIPAFAGMTACFLVCDTPSVRRGPSRGND